LAEIKQIMTADPNVGRLAEERLGSRQNEFSYCLVVDVSLDRAEYVDRRFLYSQRKKTGGY